MKKCIIVFLAFIVSLAGMIALNIAFIIPVTDIFSNSIKDLTVWHSRLNIINNSFYSWKISPLIQILSESINLFFSKIHGIEFILSMSLFAAGMTAYIYEISDKKAGLNLLLIPALCSSLILLYSFDTTVILSLSSFFWLLLFTEGFISSAKIVSTDLIGLAISLYFCCTSSNHLSLIIILIVLCYTCLTKTDIKQDKKFTLIVILLAVTIFSVNASVPVSPEYPQLSHVVPDDNIPGYIMPLFGATPPKPFIDRNIFKNYFTLPSVIVFFISLCLIGFKSPNNRKVSILLLLSLSCVLETTFSEGIASISPIYSLNRVIPGLFYIPIFPLIFAICLTLLTVIIAQSKKLLLPGIIFLFVLPLINQARNTSAAYLTISNNGISIPKAAPLVELEARLNTGMLDSTSYNRLHSKLVSPSYNIAYISGLNVFDRYNKKFSTFEIKKNKIESIFSSENSVHENLMQMFDGRLRSRWSPQLGMQKGNEWLELKFNEEKTLSGIYMPCGNFKPDFPRGIEIQSATDCSAEGDKLKGEFKTIYKSDIWEGEIAYTPAGIPYYDDQSEVRIFFDNTETLKCIRIKQTGKISSFDWSIAELELIKPAV